MGAFITIWHAAGSPRGAAGGEGRPPGGHGLEGPVGIV